MKEKFNCTKCGKTMMPAGEAREHECKTVSLETLQSAFDKIRPQVGHIYNDQFDDFIIKLWQEMNKK